MNDTNNSSDTRTSKTVSGAGPRNKIERTVTVVKIALFSRLSNNLLQFFDALRYYYNIDYLL